MGTSQCDEMRRASGAARRRRREHRERRAPYRGPARDGAHDVADVVRPSRVHDGRLVHRARLRGGDDGVALGVGEEPVHDEDVRGGVELTQARVEAVDGDVVVQGVRRRRARADARAEAAVRRRRRRFRDRRRAEEAAATASDPRADGAARGTATRRRGRARCRARDGRDGRGRHDACSRGAREGGARRRVRVASERVLSLNELFRSGAFVNTNVFHPSPGFNI